ncbi:serine/threonine-protein kinase [Hyalangium sp.]|uniref:serine/threonine-protein kinase n=1 Tax=Hyalangium sp. TaxID=2028555 RepID=UPI0038997F2C
MVGHWRVLGLCSQGTYGAVYRAVRADREDAEPVALKLALYIQDPRFEREAELLARVQHPSVPRLYERGEWQPPGGNVHPYLVMEWVEGLPLYEWAREHDASSRQVLRMLAQLAWALEATHAAGVHRDVKGDNVLVRFADQRAFLMDFGAGAYPGARPLTTPPFPPGTPAYRSPEAWRFSLGARWFQAPYAPGPADDVFALGVTAYRLVTGEYLPPEEPRQDEAGQWRLDIVPPRAPRELNPRVDPRLSELILRMLAMPPEARGTAGELAEALERAAAQAGPEAEQPLGLEQLPPPPLRPRDEVAMASLLGNSLSLELLGNKARLRALRRRRKIRARAEEDRGAHRHPNPERPPSDDRGAQLFLLFVVAAMVLFALVCPRSSEHVQPQEGSMAAQRGPIRESRDAGTSGVGDVTITAPQSVPPSALGAKEIAMEMPKDPLPGQVRPDSKGKCPLPLQVVINGGCWIKVDADLERCREATAEGYVYKNGCYMPTYGSQRQPTSTPQPPQ